jgi:hypothetical protein
VRGEGKKNFFFTRAKRKIFFRFFCLKWSLINQREKREKKEEENGEMCRGEENEKVIFTE